MTKERAPGNPEHHVSQAETQPREVLHPRYYRATMEAAKSRFPQDAPRLESVLGKIDQDGMDDVEFFRSESYPGVRTPLTHVSVNRVAEALFQQASPDPSIEPGAQDQKSALAKRIIYIDFPSAVGSQWGHPFDQFGPVTTRVINLLPRVVGATRRGEIPPNVDIYALGSVTGIGGKITPEFVQILKEKGYPALGQLYAELLRKTVLASLDLDNVSIVFEGASKASPLMAETARVLTELDALKQQERLRIYYQIPTGRTLSFSAITRALYVAPFFGAEMFALTKLSKTVAKELQDEKPFQEKLKVFFQIKGVEPDDPEQLKLKGGMMSFGTFTNEELMKMMKGVNADDYEIRSFVVRGKGDTINWSPAFFGRYTALLLRGIFYPTVPAAPKTVGDVMKQLYDKAGHTKTTGRSSEFALNTNHYIPPPGERVDKLIQRIRFCDTYQPQLPKA